MTQIFVETRPPAAAAPRVGDKQRRTQKYRTRQAAIMRMAVDLINHKGVRGMTLVDVAARLDMGPTGVIYYFASKEELAAACILKAIETYEALIRAAGTGATPSERLRTFVRGYVAYARDVALGARDPLAFFNDVRALDDPVVNLAYTNMFRNARGLLAPLPRGAPARQVLNAVTHLVLSQLFWSVVWLPLYDPKDYDRAADRLLDVLQNGLGAARVALSPGPSGPAAANEDVSRETYLRAATEIINEQGYRGASVDKISARLKVTKGSFYHHNDAKDDLVVACFRRTLDVMRRTQRAAIQTASDGWGQISTATTSLVHGQVSGATPLLRTSALTSAPEAMQSELVSGFDRISLNFASMISDGIADGSIRPVDAQVGAQMVTATINAAAELQSWTPALPAGESADAYARAFLQGWPSVIPMAV
jgi:AcrR family transcriptional regulator